MDCDVERVGAMLGLEYAEPDADVAELMRVSAVEEAAALTWQLPGISLIDLADGNVVATFTSDKPKPADLWSWKDLYDMEREISAIAFDVLQSLNEEVTRLRAQVAQSA